MSLEEAQACGVTLSAPWSAIDHCWTTSESIGSNAKECPEALPTRSHQRRDCIQSPKNLLHEHFMEPVVIRNARYMPPIAPGYSVEIKRSSRRRYQFPNGEAWRPAS